MSFTPRTYQVEAIDAAVDFMRSNYPGNGLEILPTGSGKSVVIANIASRAEGKTLVFQPSKEILEQNFAKFTAYGYKASIYSASAGMKFVDNVTFATIGSVARKPHIFRDFSNIIVDECHLVNAEDGMYKRFLSAVNGAKVLGLTATPYRLTTGMDGAMLEFITRSTPRVFNHLLYYVQNEVLFNSGHLSPLRYFNFNVVDRTMLQTNSAGTDFTEASIRSYYRQIDLPRVTAEYARMVLTKRKNLLVFCSIIEEANKVAAGVPGSVVITGDTDKRVREKILAQFKAGVIRCVINVGVLTTGFDYPELEAVLIARSTMSLALYYQIVGRVMRPHKNKDCGWVVDLGGNIECFGKIETMKIEQDRKGFHYVSNNGRRLTDIAFSKN